MKTQINPAGNVPSRPHGGNLSASASAGRWIRSGSLGAMILLLPTTSASAAGADGEYEVRTAEGSIRFAGATIRIPTRLIKNFARVNDNHVTITNNRVQIQRNGAIRFVRHLGDEVGLDLSAKVSGPTSVKLVKNGDTYTGSTSTPIVVSFEHNSFFDLEGKLKVNVDAEVRDGNLTLTMPLSGKFLSKRIGGTITVVCER